MQTKNYSTRKKIGAVNKNKLRNLKYHVRRIVFAVALAGVIGKETGVATAAPSDEYIVPNNCIEMDIDVSVSESIKVEDLAREYYVEDLYPNFKQYCKMIQDENDLKYGFVTPYQDIKIPVIVNKDNIYLNNISSLESELETLPIWVEYEIQYGDTLSSLAYLGAKDSTEAIDNIDRIARYNNIEKKNELYRGDKIYIINPKIGELRKKIYSLEESLKESLIVNDSNKQK